MNSNVILAAVVALIPAVIYVYAMRRIVHASWAEVLVPFRRPRKQAELPYHPAE